MRNFLHTVKEVLAPGQREFKERIDASRRQELRLLNCLHLVDLRVTKSVNMATDRAAEF